jgi:hypothetical protein
MIFVWITTKFRFVQIQISLTPDAGYQKPSTNGTATVLHRQSLHTMVLQQCYTESTYNGTSTVLHSLHTMVLQQCYTESTYNGTSTVLHRVYIQWYFNSATQTESTYNGTSTVLHRQSTYNGTATVLHRQSLHTMVLQQCYTDRVYIQWYCNSATLTESTYPEHSPLIKQYFGSMNTI